MNREVHVRFWEGLAVRFRWATQLVWQSLTAPSQVLIAFLRSVSTALSVGMHKIARAG